ncbi:4-Cys prefix domain-containing protein [Trichormus sp. NMC-1]|uniref:4-Cys prefix domain-containing protein n=1 Tax=Trichormus sp. NMC-1 TaxID=1853259 RepID=UPI0008DC2253|nr:4-Cys prefix domain-containing protein [Trichormus sp. NMC-1]
MSLCINPNCPKPQNADNILFCEACGSELLLEGRYRIIRQLGEGGFGKTFEVSQSNVLKVLKVLILDDSKAVSLFQQEARVLSQLNHPGIPSSQKQSSKTEKDKSSQQIYQAIGTIISGVLLIIIRLGWKDISKIFQPQVSQPVAISTPTETEENNPEQINSKATSQAPPVDNENTYPQIPYGWKKFQGGGASLWLPPNWQTGDINEKLYEFMNKSGSHNPQMEQFAQLVQQNPSNFPIWAFEPNNPYSQSFNTVMVAHEKLPNQVNLELYMRETAVNSTILGIETYSVKGHQVGRMILLGVNSKQLYYVIRDNETVWTVLFSCKKEQFEQNFPIFQTSINTFVF